MAFDMIKYERGQVWVIRWKNPTMVGREQQKDRPWLIVSVGKFNQSSGMITAVPITTRDHTRSPAQVSFTNDRGYNNVILCEQIRSFDYKSGEYLFDYMGKVSDDVLERVDVALSIHLGMHYSPITLRNLYETMESIVTSVSYMQEKESTPKFSDQDVLDFVDKMKSLAHNNMDTPKKEMSFSEWMDRAYGIIPPDEVAVTRIDESDTPEEEEKIKSHRIKWTPETRKEFLDDCSNLSIDDVMKKWNIQKKARFYSMKNYAQNLHMND